MFGWGRNNEVEAREVFGQLALPASPPLGLKPVHQIDRVKEAQAFALMDGGHAQSRRQVSFAYAGKPGAYCPVPRRR